VDSGSVHGGCRSSISPPAARCVSMDNPMAMLCSSLSGRTDLR
jgi:hypothetical protein